MRAPGRMNIIGEHTDYNLGLCLPAAIDLSIYMGARLCRHWEIHALDDAKVSNLDRKHSNNWEVYFTGVLDVLKRRNLDASPMQVYFCGDLPAGAGLSSSSAICCAWAYLLNEVNGWRLTREEITKIAVEGERANGLEGGMMDQIAIMHGRRNHALLINCANWSIRFIPCVLSAYRWIIVDTKVKRQLVHSEYNSRSRACSNILRQLKAYFPDVSSISNVQPDQLSVVEKKLKRSDIIILKYVLNENQRVLDVCKALERDDAVSIGSSLLEGHRGLRDEYQVSCTELDFLVSFAERHPHCAGARMMGGGFGGSTVHLVQTQHVDDYTEQIAANYAKAFGIKPGIYLAEISESVSLIQ